MMDNRKFALGLVGGLLIGFILMVYIDSVAYTPCYSDLCVSNPIGEVVTKIQKAQVGIVTMTDTICLKTDEGFKSSSLTDKLSNVDSITFQCEDDPVCKDQNSAVDVTPDSILARRDLKFRGLIECEKSNQNYDCVITVQSS